MGLHAGRKNLVYDKVLGDNSCGIVVDNSGCAAQIVTNMICGNRGRESLSEDDKEKRVASGS